MKKEGSSKLKHQLVDVFATGFLIFSVPFFRWVPLKLLVFLSKRIGTFAFHFCGKYRKRVIANLSLAFGKEKDSKEIHKLSKEVFYHLTLTPLETIYLASNAIPVDRFTLKIRIEGKEYLEAALAQGKGAIALGAHFGSFTLLGTRLAVEGYPLNLIVKVGRYPKLWRRLADYQKLLGQRTIPLKPTSVSIKRSLNCLHRNEILYIVADERQRRGGLPTLFFNEIAFTPAGPAVFSLKTGAPILPMFVLRNDDIRRTLVIKPPLEFERTGDDQRDVERLTHLFTKAIEETVRKHPSQWAWLNKRWGHPR